MNLAEISIKRPVFLTSIIILLLTAGLLSLRSFPTSASPF